MEKFPGMIHLSTTYGRLKPGACSGLRHKNCSFYYLWQIETTNGHRKCYSSSSFYYLWQIETFRPGVAVPAGAALSTTYGRLKPVIPRIGRHALIFLLPMAD